MKQLLRAKFRLIRDEIPPHTKSEASAVICEKLNQFMRNATCLASYAALNSEVNIIPHTPYALPAIVGDILEFRMWDHKSELIPGKYCKEPKEAPSVIPDIIIVPCLSFDRKGHRLGYGKGFYDRTLALDKYKNALKIGVAYAAQECEELPSDTHDIPLDMIVTELEVIHCPSLLLCHPELGSGSASAHKKILKRVQDDGKREGVCHPEFISGSTSGTPIKEIIQAAKLELQSLGFNTPQLDAELLLAHALGIAKDMLFMKHEEQVPDAPFKALLERRKQFEPIAYIIGHKEFWGMDFKVTKDTLIPRPDSETIIEFVLSTFPNKEMSYKILDLGTGTGCLGLSLLSEYKKSHATLVDVSKKALEIASFNAKNLGFKDQVTLIQSSWFESLTPQKFDIIICNPPYIDTDEKLIPDVSLYEPHSALFAGDNGYLEYKKIAEKLHEYLDPNSAAFFEFGRGQEIIVSDIFSSLNYKVIGIKKDLSGINRVIGLQIPQPPHRHPVA